MFSKKLDILITELDTNNAEIAACSGFDRTNVSRFRNGNRLPEPSSKSVQKLIEGLLIFARDHDRMEILCKMTGASMEDPDDDIKLAILKWLYKDEHSIKKPIKLRNNTNSNQKQSGNIFGTRLTEAMKLADISNISLSRMLSVDASLISRYRSGLCMPRFDSDSINRIGSILFRRINKNERINELAELMQCEAVIISESRFTDWLYDFVSHAPADESALARLLEIFEAYNPEEVSFAFDVTDYKSETLNEPNSQYLGIKGLRNAVIRFLRTAYESDGKELMLYSDQDMSWLTDLEEFRAGWTAMMARCIKKGIHIRIIHNIDRGLDEMNMAIKSWLPLYMSGKIEPYYNDMARDSRFFHTLFICPGVAAIDAFGAAGAEDNVIYHYYSNKEGIGSCIAAYDRLMDNAKPLIKTGSPDAFSQLDGNVTVIRNTLSVGTMPKELIDELADARLSNIWEIRKRTIFGILKEHELYEYATLADVSELNEGNACIEGYTRGIKMNYTREQYEKHLDNILSMSDAYPGYHFCILPEVMLKDMTIAIGESFVVIIYDKLPDFTISFMHPLMVRAFKSFAGRLHRLCRLRPAELKKEISEWKKKLNRGDL